MRPLLASPHRRVARLLALALLAFCPGSPSAADDVPSRFEAAKTPKGLSFHWREDTTTPFAAVTFAFRDAYALTTPGKEALNGFGPSMIMQGGNDGRHGDLMERLADLTATASISLGPFASQGTVRAPTATISPSLAATAAALKTAVPGDRFVTRMRQRAVNGEAQDLLRPETIAQRTGLRVVLGDHPVTRGFDPDRFGRIGPDDLAAWRKSVLSRDRLRIAVSGRIGREDAARMLDEAFADLPVLPSPPLFAWPEFTVKGGTVVVEHATPQSAVVMIGLTSIGPALEVETALVANAVLGGSSGRLWQGVRASLGSTYGASSGLQLVGPGKRLVTLRAAVANDQVKASVAALREAYTEWRRAGVTAAELEAVTSRLITEARSALDDPARANGLVIGMQMANRPVEDVYSYGTRIGQLDRETLNTFISKKFPSPEDLVTVIVTPNGDGLSATCIIRVLDEAERCR
jgi:predicted Zn-dependent peptidase